MTRLTAALIALAPLAAGQTLTLTVNDPRPVHAAVLEMERLSGTAINYEDVQYNYPSDVQDVSVSAMNASQRAQAPPGVQVIVPRGGQLVVLVGVDAATGRLKDRTAVMGALSQLLTVANTAETIAAGKFTVENVNNQFFVAPSQWRSATGASVAATPVLSVPITLTGQPMTGWDTLNAVLRQVAAASGAQVVAGTMPMGMFALSKVSVSASKEPARYVLARLFADIISAGPSATSAPTMGYHLLFDPKQREYVLNVEVIPSASPDPPSPIEAPVLPSPGFGVRAAQPGQ